MPTIDVKPLREDLAFGARISGVTLDALATDEVRRQLNAAFEDRGLLVFEGIEPSSKMQLRLSTVFGPLKDHPVPGVPQVDRDKMPGVIELGGENMGGGKVRPIVEIGGKRLTGWLPWHFDHCYNNELNRAGVLRAVEIPPEGGRTGFADGIELYRSFSPALRDRIEGQSVIYTLDLLFAHMRFGKPSTFREIVVDPSSYNMADFAKTLPRAIHPAVWSRASGEKILHVSPWMAVGLQGHEDPAGDELLEEVCEEILDKVNPYFHQWKLTEMVVWDNWRVLHSVSGHDPQYDRRMHRTTIKGDYGLGSFENNATGHKVLETTV